MDPDACLERIASDDLDDAMEACQDLADWLARGGFAPNWSKNPRGEQRFRQWQKAS